MVVSYQTFSKICILPIFLGGKFASRRCLSWSLYLKSRSMFFGFETLLLHCPFSSCVFLLGAQARYVLDFRKRNATPRNGLGGHAAQPRVRDAPERLAAQPRERDDSDHRQRCWCCTHGIYVYYFRFVIRNTKRPAIAGLSVASTVSCVLNCPCRGPWGMI